ncbi:hypothetical protein PCK1_002503 [Pneumocystis canis]|nr:hypothetical protein PCK1_002503 [Pneumocystis canis]
MSVRKKKKNRQSLVQLEKSENSNLQNELSFFGTLSLEDEKYFRGVEEMLMIHRFSREEYRLFVDNIFLEIQGRELKLAINPLYSKTLETLLHMASPSQLKRYFQALVGNFKKLICDCFGSHVCETLLVKLGYIASTEDIHHLSQDDNEIFITAENLILFMCNEIFDVILTFSSHKYASYVFYQLFLVLHGIILQTDLNSEKSIKHKRKIRSLSQIVLTKQLQMPVSFYEKKKFILDNINAEYGVTEVRNLAFNQYGSQVMSVLLLIERSLIKSDKNRKQILLEKLVFGDFKENSFNVNSTGKDVSDSFIETLLRDHIGSYVFESVIEFSSEEILQKLYNIYFKNRIFKVSKHPIGNYVLQKFIEKNDDYKVLDEISEKIIDHFEELIDIGHTGILVSLITSHSQNPSNCVKFINVLKECFVGSKVELKDYIFPLILNLDPRNKNNSLKSFKGILNDDNVVDDIKIQGACLIKSFLMLPYEMYYFLIESLILQDKKIILYYATNKIASGVLEIILKLPTLSASDRRKLLNNFFESYGNLSCDPSGSHIIDACLYTSVGLNNYRERIANELLKSGEIIRDDYYEWKKNLDSFMQNELLKSCTDSRIINTRVSNSLSSNNINSHTNSLSMLSTNKGKTDEFDNDPEKEIDMLFRKNKKKKLT